MTIEHPQLYKEEEKALEKKLFLNIFELPEFETKSLKERIEKNNGVVRIFVHPFFEEAQQWHTPVQKEKILAIGRVIKKILKLDPDKTPPLFVAQEYYSIADLEKKLGEEAQEKIYIIPTFPASPEPRLPDDVTEAQDVYASQKWKVLTRQLKELGIKKILIGGMFLAITARRVMDENEKTGIRLELNNCVGTTATILSRDFEIEISNLSYPHGRNEYQAAKREVNQEFQH